MIDITPTAATKVRELLEESGKSDHALRIFVRGMSCSGPAYGRLARLYHPDLNPRPEAAARMRAINAAYRVLADARQRAVYDAQLYLRPRATVVAAQPRVRPVVIVRNDDPTPLQRRVDRI